ncbi:hypothetical protein SH668x_000337 [Planctomicrobium sp. SH668]|uniref:hypothetical protein n=1 Tax=Planctomicrobium sp. SH668 TaxID=3448126 RepID=UPI003F5C3599
MDSYALCPCGSGKKVKFCCQAIIPEMGKIERLQENNQPRMALQIIDKLLKDHAENPWLINQRAMALISDERYEEARDNLVAFLRKSPEHPLSNGLLAISMTELEPISQCKKVIHRAFLKSMNAEPRIAAILAGKLVDHFLSSGQDMAARQHMAVILRLEKEEERQRTLMAMLEMDADSSIPYPLRGAHPLPQYQPAEEHQAQFRKAQRLYIHACFSEAADILDQLVQHDPNSAKLQHMIGLMRAWDGDEVRAAAALHKAAELYTETEAAVDVEAIAQLLDRRQAENTTAARVRTYEVESLSRLLTRLDNEDRLSRIPLLEDALRSGVAAGFDILDRTLPSDKDLDTITLDSVPRTIGQITLFDKQEDGTPAVAHVNALEGVRLDESVRTFEAAAGELAKPSSTDGEDQQPNSDVLGWYSVDELALSESAFFPPKTPNTLRNTLRRQFVEKCIDETWLNTPTKALNGKTPLEASKEPTLKIALTAALRVFDSYLDRRSVILDKKVLEEKLGLESPAPITVSEEMDLNTLSVAQLDRLDVSQLSDKMFDRLLQRALVVKHAGIGHRVLTALLNDRPQMVKEMSQEAEQAHITLAEICSRALLDNEALDWLKRGYQLAKANGANFEAQLMWKMRELSLRARDTDDPEFKEVLLELWNHYGSKLPAVRARLDEFVRALGIEAPWSQSIMTPELAAAGAWSADSNQTSTSEKKLWLPE